MTDKAQLTNSLKAWQSLREIVSQKKLTHLKKDRTAWQHRLKLLEHSKSHWDQYNHLKQLKHLIAMLLGCLLTVLYLSQDVFLLY